MIPKKIHYCWFGHGTMSKKQKKCIESWKKYCLDYEIIEWNETNFDVNTNAYTKYCYENKRWAFLSDYVRLCVVAEHGGLYFDTDVELIGSFDFLLEYDGFYSFENPEYVNTGQGFGSAAGQEIVVSMKQRYEELVPDENGQFSEVKCPRMNTDTLLEFGLQLNGKKQNLGNIMILPAQYMNPYDDPTGRLRVCSETISIHWYAKSWVSWPVVLRSKLTKPIHRLMWREKKDEGDKPIRILMIGYYDRKGGVESYVLNLCKHLDSRKYEVYHKLSEITVDGKTWKCPPNRHNFVKYYLFWKRFYRKNHFDVLYLNACDMVSIDELKFAKTAGIPVRIIHSHCAGNQLLINKKSSLFHRLCEYQSRKNLHKYATHLLACSKTAGDWMFDGREYEVIPNGIELESYQYNTEWREKRRREIGVQAEPVIGVIGRLTAVKNPDFIIKVMEAVREREPSAKMIMLGDGDLRESVKQQVKEKGLQKSVFLMGAVDNVNEWLSAMDCLLMPSITEGLPFALIEAQGSGLPCVVSTGVSQEANVTGLVEYIDLSEDVTVWANVVCSKFGKNRNVDTESLIATGYDIRTTAGKISDMIERRLEDK